MNLADEIMGAGVRRPPLTGIRRRHFCLDDGILAEQERAAQKRREYARAWAKANREKVVAYAKKHYQENKAKRDAQKKAWKLKNRAHVLAYDARKARERRRADPEHAKAIRKKSLLRHRDRELERRKAYYAKNRDRINADRRERARKARADKKARSSCS